MIQKCTCGTEQNHSIFCSGSFYKDPLREPKYKPKSSDEKTCDKCFLILNKSQFIVGSETCKNCHSQPV